jgi:hypothetical protein
VAEFAHTFAHELGHAIYGYTEKPNGEMTTEK